jgi:hypothetical protein
VRGTDGHLRGDCHAVAPRTDAANSLAVAEGFEPYSGCRSRARKALYLRKRFTLTHTQTYILVGKCGQNVGTNLAGRSSDHF